MPAQTFYQVIESVLNENQIEYDYFDYNNNTFSKDLKTRICHIKFSNNTECDKDIVAMIFTIRN